MYADGGAFFRVAGVYKGGNRRRFASLLVILGVFLYKLFWEITFGFTVVPESRGVLLKILLKLVSRLFNSNR